ncbi:hypothetical protein AXF42_Ash007402 [Apostasia shenzhenica]|uniref:Plus3 domain-containing protein n=1 Tax=Apostasia shenzhenica TaxID=1088818 RepID=A0A2I0BA35_9ASPA|nr:hypothetical protein AXF42_Ash007402 [Apostasia shenzhenica]
MADLENLLLQAAGRTGTSARRNQSRPHSRWRREGSYSDGSDSKEDDLGKSKFNKRRHSGPQVPLKKRFEPPEKDKRSNWLDDHDDRLSGDDSDSAPSVGSDLYKDEADKEALGKMSELDREMILAERSTKIDDYRLKKKARASSTRAGKSTKESPPPFPSRSRSSVRTDKTGAKTDALNELRAKRMRQQDAEGYRRSKDSVGVIGSSFGIRESSSSKPRSLTIPALDSSDSDDEGISADGKHEKSPEDIDIGDNLEDVLTSKTEPIRYEDVKGITLRRSKLAKWLMEPFFEEIVVGCFVRVGIGKTQKGPKYRLCVIKNVDASDPDRQYKLEGRTTCKWLNCVWGSEASAARWQMAMVSDSLPTDDEFKEWAREVERTGGRIPCRQDVDDKKEEIRKASTFVYSAETVKQMLQEKKSASSRPMNVAAEKDRLRKEVEVAESRGHDNEVEKLRAKLKELEDFSRQAKRIDAKAVRLAEMNRRNRAENFRNASELKPVNTSLKAGEAGYDPFSRRWTRSRNYYVPAKPGEDGNGASTNGFNGNASLISGDTKELAAVIGVEAGAAATVAALEAAAGAGKLVDTSAPVDRGTELNSLHDFDLPISLAGLQKFGGPQGVHLGFMARKQKIEAAIGYRVPENDGRRHILTLSVSDYKRRRGLL